MSTYDELVEKAARALCASQNPDTRITAWHAYREQWLQDARAVLDAVGDELRAEAYERGADVIHSEARWQWERDLRGVVGAQLIAQRMTVIEGVLRGFANNAREGDELRAEGWDAFRHGIATQHAHNGAGDPGQEFYDRGLNAWLNTIPNPYRDTKGRAQHPHPENEWRYWCEACNPMEGDL